jgi:ABC-2 type transport system ATP-binding protein
VEQVCDRVAIVDRGIVVAEGTLASVLGARETRVRCETIPSTGLADLERFGRVRVDGREIVLDDLPEGRVPDLVAALVGLGVRVQAVSSGRESLEQRFLELVGHRAEGAA